MESATTPASRVILREGASTPAVGGGVRAAVERATRALLRLQQDDGHWCFPLEADCTIPAEYVLMMHFLDEIDFGLQERLARYLRAEQADHGGWPLYHGGAFDISCSVKAYWALKLAGDDPAQPHMVRARAAILAAGGAARANVFTRYALAMFDQVPWRAVPFLPAELIWLPSWAPFSWRRVSYWTRAVAIPLSILYTLRARAANPTGIDVLELFTTPPDRERHYFQTRSMLNRAFLTAERCVRRVEGLIPGFVRRRAVRAAERWMLERLNGIDGLGGVFPSMVNALESMHVLGYPREHPQREVATQALRRLVIDDGESAYCQPCVSPIWDTALAALALDETRATGPDPALGEVLDRALTSSCDWLVGRQQLDGPADWRATRPGVAPGGWPFQYRNDHYPDLDDSSAVIWALARVDTRRYAESIGRGLDWVACMQSSNGGYGAFDVDNDDAYLLEIPFCDHGALLDPPTADVSARCLAVFGRAGRPQDRQLLARCLDYLLAEQEDCGAWFGRWGTNYVYGTWCVLAAFEHVRDPRVDAARARAVAWLASVQRDDGSWGESNDSYEDPTLAGRGQIGTAYQTAWALLALLAAGQAHSDVVARGIAWLQRAQRPDGLWVDRHFTAPGFPRVFYLRYHGYSAYFPLWALARYERERPRAAE
ncbi:MAG: squalene--hopene cyclase [Planctomycetes bacterium]|nr:squalene--hopene cyclase [Planctomycetota bacterium]